MVWLFVILLLFFALFYILTRVVWVRIIKGEKFKVEIHLPIFAIHLIKKDDNGDNKKKPIKEKNKPLFFGYLRIITGVVARIKNASILVNSIILPVKTDNFDKSAILRPLRQQALLCAFIAYLRTKTEKLTLSDNAIILSPDVDVIHCYVTIKLRLYELIHGLLSVWHSINEEKERTKGERRHARE